MKMYSIYAKSIVFLYYLLIYRCVTYLNKISKLITIVVLNAFGSN